MAMAVLPEEFPVVLTVFLALGAWRISRNNVLTRRMPAVETLGAATVLCVDKTGTLTQNRMTLKQLAVERTSLDLSTLVGELPEEVHRLLENAVLACKRDPFDPMERALLAARDRWLTETEHLHPDWSLIREYPLTPDLLAVSHAWNTGNGDEAIVAAKGAPEAILDLCHLEPLQRQELSQRVSELAAQGLRVLGVARGRSRISSLPEGHHDLSFEFLGLIGFVDPLRPTVPAAVATCQSAGIRVVMITGDYPATAQSIAQKAGIAHCEAVLSGTELDRLSDTELAKRIGSVRVFARVVPEQKLRIVQALKANHEVVAMTGDGVNDAPALKAANIGIAMGARGTDVAREAASLVLLDDDFSSIVAAICLGRRIFDNIKKAITFILAVHLPIVGLSMLPVFFADWPLLLLPVHIVFLELIIDPTCSLIFEAEPTEADVMQRPPRNPNERLFSLPVVGVALLQGLSILLVCLVVFLLARRDHSADAARALTFATLVTAFVVVILVNRSFTRSAIAMLTVPNTALRWVVLFTGTFLAIALVVPFAQHVFHFAPLHTTDVVFSLSAGLICVLWFELVKLAKRHRITRRVPRG
jgi:Ca2+-transporting ATPase